MNFCKAIQFCIDRVEFLKAQCRSFLLCILYCYSQLPLQQTDFFTSWLSSRTWVLCPLKIGIYSIFMFKSLLRNIYQLVLNGESSHFSLKYRVGVMRVLSLVGCHVTLSAFVPSPLLFWMPGRACRRVVITVFDRLRFVLNSLVPSLHLVYSIQFLFFHSLSFHVSWPDSCLGSYIGLWVLRVGLFLRYLLVFFLPGTMCSCVITDFIL